MERQPVESVLISKLKESDSPRLAGADVEHARLLAMSGAELPPIVVHRDSMRVIDGAHRLRAALLRGQDTIAARFFDGPAEDAFVIAVESNTLHGLPLSAADRIAAAERIIASHPHWSDRAIAAKTALAAKTVRAVRERCSAGGTERTATRVGLDGRIRPLNAEAGRRQVTDLITAHPEASVREIAKLAGVSPSTVHGVRKRMRAGAGQDEVADIESVPVPRTDNDTADQARSAAVLASLRKDPSLRFNESGRALLRWLESTAIDQSEWQRLLASIPAHRAQVIAELARANAGVWTRLANELNVREQSASI